MRNTVYRFGDFELDAAARELKRNGEPLALPRRAFDCILYLIEHCDRAVGRDELTAAVWGRIDVTDAQLSQIMLYARRALGDSGQAQQAIRTLPGFGYRWATTIAATPQTNGDAAPAATKPPTSHAGDGGIGEPIRTVRSRPVWRRAAVGVLLLAAIAAFAIVRFVSQSAVVTNDTPSAYVVLPMQVAAPRESGWVRLGAMDLVADRLRSAGLPVPPSESVLVALGGVDQPLDAEERQKLARVLGAGSLIEGAATRTNGVWKIELATTTPDGLHHTAEMTHADFAEAARRVSDLLLAELGRAPPKGPEETDGIEELVQQVQAAFLAGEIETARTILENASDSQKSDPRIRLRLAQVDAHAGRFDAAEAAYKALIDDPAVRAEPSLYARVLASRGGLRGRRTQFAAAERDFDAAVERLGNTGPPSERARALNGRGVARTELHRFDEAARDLGQARIEFQQAGDRLGLIQSDTNLGLLEAERGRMEQALPYLIDAADRFEAFGATERMLAVLVDVFDAQAALLRWPEALAATERQWAHRSRAGDPGLGLLIGVNRAVALTALGRLREADAALTDAEHEYGNAGAEVRRHLLAARAELAWRRGRAAEAAAASEQALSIWADTDTSDARRARLIVLRQRSAFASGAADVQPLAQAASADASALLDVARAERAAHHGDDASAEPLFVNALASAEAHGVPADIALAAQAYGYWLLAHGRADEAGALAGRIAPWAARDFDCTLFQLAALHARGHHQAWADALRQAGALAGERQIPEALQRSPTS